MEQQRVLKKAPTFEKRKKMRTLALSTFFCLVIGFCNAQYNPNARPGYGIQMQDAPPQEDTMKVRGFDPSKLVFGGNLALSFGDFTFINVSPQVGYMFSPMFTAGAGVNYINSISKFKDVNGNELYRETFGYAGMNLFGRFFPTNFLFAMVQPEMNYNWGKVSYNYGSLPDTKLDSKWVPTFLVGAGIVMGGGGGRGGMMLSIQYDLAQDPRSPYGSNAFISMGYSF
jgi:hypothetical protein